MLLVQTPLFSALEQRKVSALRWIEEPALIPRPYSWPIDRLESVPALTQLSPRAKQAALGGDQAALCAWVFDELQEFLEALDIAGIASHLPSPAGACWALICYDEIADLANVLRLLHASGVSIASDELFLATHSFIKRVESSMSSEVAAAYTRFSARHPGRPPLQASNQGGC